MNFAVMVSGAPYSTQACDSALHFARAVLRCGHSLQPVFFYHDGAWLASELNCPPQDDRHLVREWQNFAAECGVELAVCTASAQRRGILDHAEAARHGKPRGNLAGGFRVAGLGQLAGAMAAADRFVHFGP
ncbi:MAG: sulfurtransferase complex subunit TusD [Gammaproteobacteria bacterium]|nr:sulfurtransferase complex subunit TusD [Gammaproteobacteria bacterium]MDD9799014.1 sulfurtransferase complex subunit TusD [Gammaproteobacteria bacterium]MDD9815150.1 sulfurtransferase complex subunit TusD [Gammaproteobacteria bacterium]MDD9851554.1 sulfurtransferase complex subunit TusD [Gammaproteobacteria bacterium]MDD9871707.1 sulfurtransferase complex subunit TusD [Gammaproteobacteria bacterium]